MIYAIRCDQPQFKDVEFLPGFNVVLAERSEQATAKDSRNGLGKTTLIDIIHFCLGAKADANNRVMAPPLKDWTFSLELDLRGKRYTVSRSTGEPKRVTLEGDFSDWPSKPKPHKDTGAMVMSNSEWSEVLGWLMFDLPQHADDRKYHPSARGLVTYFVRRGRSAFSDPFVHEPKQLEWDKQIHNAYLLGLSTDHVSQAQEIRDRENTLKELKKAGEAGTLPDLLGTIGQLETDKVRLEQKVERTAEQLRTFRVHPQYQEVQDRADTLQSSIRKLNIDIAGDQAMKTFYQESLREEQAIDNSKIARVYSEAGVALPELVLKRLGDVQTFHRQVVANRRNFLQAEIARLSRAITERTDEIRTLTEERASLMGVLQTHGALAEYSELQRLNNQDQAQLERVLQRMEMLKQVEQGKITLRIEQEQLNLLTASDYEDRRSVRERAIGLFNTFSETLYQRPGRLIIDVASKGGFRFGVDIERKDSHGVEQMKVFCYDLVLAELWATHPVHPGFLVHDSTLFADVDERQKAQALELAAREASAKGFQYICCLNSDTLPVNDFSENFNIDQYVRLRLTDATESGGLLGIRF
jgi:uncharacterized protein YydD (DUF2326 family)